MFLQTLQGPLADGSILKEVTDGTNAIAALFTTEAVEGWRKYVPNCFAAMSMC